MNVTKEQSNPLLESRGSDLEPGQAHSEVTTPRKGKALLYLFLGAGLFTGLVVLDEVYEIIPPPAPDGADMPTPLQILFMLAVIASMGAMAIGYVNAIGPRRVLRLADTLVRVFTGASGLTVEQPSSRAVKDRNGESIRQVLRRLEDVLDHQAREGPSVHIPESRELIEAVAVAVRESLSADVIDAVRAEYGGLDAEKSFSETRSLIEDAIIKLGARLNQNLIIGTVFALAGMACLLVFATSIPTPDDPALLLTYFLPRLAFVLVIELFSYFFLNLYRSGLSDMKFYQNELTGVESRYIAAQFALSSGSNELLTQIALELAKIDRNLGVNSTGLAAVAKSGNVNALSEKEVLRALAETVRNRSQ